MGVHDGDVPRAGRAAEDFSKVLGIVHDDAFCPSTIRSGGTVLPTLCEIGRACGGRFSLLVPPEGGTCCGASPSCRMCEEDSGGGAGHAARSSLLRVRLLSELRAESAAAGLAGAAGEQAVVDLVVKAAAMKVKASLAESAAKSALEAAGKAEMAVEASEIAETHAQAAARAAKNAYPRRARGVDSKLWRGVPQKMRRKATAASAFRFLVARMGQGQRAQNLTEQEIAEMLHTAAIAAGHGGSGEGVKLSVAPTGTIADKFSSVLGDACRYMNRAKMPMHHSSKKGYYVALQNAWFVWDASILERVKASLRAYGMADERIEAKMYHDVSYFHARKPRVVPPPSKLYWRVRAVYAVYGPKCDENGKPLFNDAAWGKADNVFRKILAGLASDPPGFLIYKQPLADSHGNALYDCSRGSNHPEAHHKGLVTTFGTWNVGVWMASVLLKWHRHCYNQRVSERLRPGFPVLDMYDTWLIDLLQVLVSQKWSVLLFPEWSNTGDFAPTAETFDTVPLHSTELGAAIDQITLPATLKLTPEHAFIAKSMDTKLPLLPVHGKEDNVLFHSLVLAAPPGPLNFDSMAIEWCKHADGKAIFPKLPVYLREHFADWERNQKVRKAVSGAAAQLARLEALNRHTAPASLPAPIPATAASPPTRTIPAFIHPTPVLVNVILPTSALLTSALLPTTVLANPILPISTFPTSAFPTSALPTSVILPPDGREQLLLLELQLLSSGAYSSALRNLLSRRRSGNKDGTGIAAQTWLSALPLKVPSVCCTD
ncbi:hypothetical protein T492DRAFT_904426 [Pavlovales sp. CCMP2436]|nr:hypothetical protein T492DRAFT_904426 [Pavlovales sp. CCMP2436]